MLLIDFLRHAPTDRFDATDCLGPWETAFFGLICKGCGALHDGDGLASARARHENALGATLQRLTNEGRNQAALGPPGPNNRLANPRR